MNGTMIYAPSAAKLEQSSFKTLLEYKKRFVEKICVLSENNDQLGTLIATDRNGHRRLFMKKDVFTKRELQALFPKLSRLIYPVRSRKQSKPTVLYAKYKPVHPNFLESEKFKTVFIEYLLKRTFRFNSADIHAISPILANQAIGRQDIIDRLESLEQDAVRIFAMRDKKAYIIKSIRSLKEAS